MNQKEYIFNNVLIALSAGALFWSNNQFERSTVVALFTLAVCLLTFAAYNQLRKTIHRKLTFLFAGAGLGIITFQLDKIPQVGLITFAGLLYLAYPFLRQITGIKNITIAAVWALFSCFNLDLSSPHFVGHLLSTGCWIFSLSVLCDLLDYSEDRDHISTLPLAIGYYPAFAVSFLFALLALYGQPHFAYGYVILWAILANLFLIKKKTLSYHLIEVSSLILVILQFLSVFYDKS